MPGRVGMPTCMVCICLFVRLERDPGFCGYSMTVSVVISDWGPRWCSSRKSEAWWAQIRCDLREGHAGLLRYDEGRLEGPAACVLDCEFRAPRFSKHRDRAVTAIDSAAVLAVLEPIWLAVPDTAKRVLQRIGTVLDFAHIKGLVPEEISLRSVARGLPRQTRQVTHRAAMPYEDTPAFMKALSALPSTSGRDALKLTVLTAVRSNETRKACWGMSTCLA